ncbi:MAG TPA: response regulator [Bryobacteraceae bacterium]|nr:response regulator [Bryobacteraceae bacterium]
MNLRVLLIENEAKDVIFLRDVLTEIEDGRFWDTWIHIESVHASTLGEACAILLNDPFDLILLDPDLSDAQGIETFRRVQSAAAHTPVVLLTGAADDGIALKMVREGAQDFLNKKEVDCAPLAHAIRTSIERHRLIAAARAGAVIDSLTGLPNRGGFFTFADRDRKLADRLGRRLMILIAEPRNLAELAASFGHQRRDLALVETADHLRSIAGATDLVARIGEKRFAIAVFETDVESLEQSWARIHAAADAHRISIGCAMFDGNRPVSLDVLLEQAALDLRPGAMAAQTSE